MKCNAASGQGLSTGAPRYDIITPAHALLDFSDEVRTAPAFLYHFSARRRMSSRLLARCRYAARRRRARMMREDFSISHMQLAVAADSFRFPHGSWRWIAPMLPRSIRRA